MLLSEAVCLGPEAAALGRHRRRIVTFLKRGEMCARLGANDKRRGLASVGSEVSDCPDVAESVDSMVQ